MEEGCSLAEVSIGLGIIHDPCWSPLLFAVLRPAYLRLEFRKTEGQDDVKTHSVIYAAAGRTVSPHWFQGLRYLCRVCVNIAERGVHVFIDIDPLGIFNGATIVLDRAGYTLEFGTLTRQPRV